MALVLSIFFRPEQSMEETGNRPGKKV